MSTLEHRAAQIVARMVLLEAEKHPKDWKATILTLANPTVKQLNNIHGSVPGVELIEAAETDTEVAIYKCVCGEEVFAVITRLGILCLHPDDETKAHNKRSNKRKKTKGGK